MPSAAQAGRFRAVSPLLLFAPTIFLSAWLLFQVQPMFAKMALPLLGGTPAVWNTALVFFQATLLLGYLYAHGLGSRLALGWQVVIHLGVLGLAFVALPVAIGENWLNPSEETPIFWLIALFGVSVGLPFFAVSANSPLLQNWFGRTAHASARDPYFLYSASNLGSILALLAYPFAIEPNLRLMSQSWLWSGGYAVLVAMIAGCALYVWRYRNPGTAKAAAEYASAAGVRWGDRLRWIALAFVPSGLLVAATTLMTTDLAAIPLLWIVPLTIYLLSFVLVFARKPILAGRWTARIQAVLLCFAAVLSTWTAFVTSFIVLVLVLATLFSTSLVCHGELVRRRPAARRLTEFYVWMSLGGILGSAFCALLAPLIFDSVIEFAVLLVLAAFLRAFLPSAAAPAVQPAWRSAFAAATLREVGIPAAAALAAVGLALHDVSGNFATNATLLLTIGMLILALVSAHRPIRLGLALAVLAGLAMSFPTVGGTRESLHRERTFFATHQVLSLENGRFVALLHGSTIHGVQAVDPAQWREPLGYFHADAGIGRIFRALEARGRTPRSVAVLGLGSGALACYRRAGQDWTFFEIDPAVVRIAKDRRYFHFLAECTPDARMVIGDGRLLLAREPAARYDLLVADAFSSDSIPVHLYTREAIQLYFDKLTPNGLLLLNVSNRYINIEPAMAAIVREAGLAARILRSRPPDNSAPPMHFGAFWIAIARTESTLAPLTDAFDAEQPTAWGRWQPLRERKGVRAWTDDYSNLVDVIE